MMNIEGLLVLSRCHRGATASHPASFEARRARSSGGDSPAPTRTRGTTKASLEANPWPPRMRSSSLARHGHAMAAIQEALALARDEPSNDDPC